MVAVCLCAPFDEGLDVSTEYAVFGEAELDRLIGMSDVEGQRLSAGGLFALRCLAKKYLSDSKDLTIVRARGEKPRFCRGDIGDFNISHSHRLSVAALLLGGTGKVGIDIEIIANKSNFKKLSERFFSNAEREYLNAHSYSMRSFFEIWTAKEALVKLKGGGLSDLTNSDTLSKELSELCFTRFSVKYYGVEYIMTVCAEADEKIEVICKCEEIEINEI